MAKVVVTFKLEEGIYSKLRESLTDRLQNKKHVSTPDFITFIREQKDSGKSWAQISSLVLERYGIALDKEQLNPHSPYQTET